MIKLPEIYVGVDVSKDKLDIHFYPIRKSFIIGNNKTDMTKLTFELSKYYVKQITCEATGGYEKPFVKELKEKSYSVRIEDPRRIRGFIIASGCKAKTDKIDAKKIAEFAFHNFHNQKEYVQIKKSENQERIQSLTNRRNDLILFESSEKTRLQHPSHEQSIPSIKRIIRVLEKEIAKIEREIQEIIDSDASLKRKAEILESVPGVGKVASSTLISHLFELGILENGQISAIAGLCPYDHQSGKHKGKSFIRGGRPIPRKVLYMCAMSACRCNDKIKEFFDRMIQAGKSFKVAIVAAMNKLPRILNTLIKKDELWNPNI